MAMQQDQTADNQQNILDILEESWGWVGLMCKALSQGRAMCYPMTLWWDRNQKDGELKSQSRKAGELEVEPKGSGQSVKARTN